MEKVGISKTFNVERRIAEAIKKIVESGQQHSHGNRVAWAKQLVTVFNIPEVPYKYPKTKFKINGKSHGIDACAGCDIQTHQTATKTGWVCDRCGHSTN